jgi:hypothetical protein
MYQEQTRVVGRTQFGHNVIAGDAFQEPEQMPELQQAIEKLRMAVEELESAQSALIARLYPVTRPEEKANGAVGQNASHPVLSPVSTQIGVLEGRVNALIADVRGVLSRLAV